MNTFEQLFDTAGVTFIKCRVVKQIGSDLFSPNRIGSIIEAEEKGVQQLIDDGYVMRLDTEHPFP